MKSNYDKRLLSSKEVSVPMSSSIPVHMDPVSRPSSAGKLVNFRGRNELSKRVIRDLELETHERARKYTTEMLYSQDINKLYKMITTRLLSHSSTATYQKNTDFVKFIVITVVGSYRDVEAEGFTSFLTSRDRGIKPMEKFVAKYPDDDEDAANVLLDISGVRKQLEYDIRYALVEFTELCSYMYVKQAEQSAIYEYFGQYKNMIFGHMCSFVDCTLNYVCMKYLNTDPMVPEEELREERKKTEELSKALNELSVSNSQLCKKVESLEERLDSNKDITYLKDVNSELSLAISRLESKHFDAINEIRRLRDIIKDLGMQELEEDGRISDSDESLVDIDSILNGRFAFVGLSCGDRSTFINSVLEKFPNSIFMDGNKDLSGMSKYDAVVFFCAFSTHSYYYKVKKYCKTNKIKFLHCNDFNIDIIVNQLRTLMSYNI